MEKLRGLQSARSDGVGRVEDRETVVKLALLGRNEDVRCVESEVARDIELKAVLSSGARAQERMPTTAVAEGHMVMSETTRRWIPLPSNLDCIRLTARVTSGLNV